MKDWRPHIDLDRLTAALAEEILAASDEEIRSAQAATGRSFARVTEAVRDLIGAASGDQDAPDPNLLSPKEAREHARLLRHH